MRFSKANLRTDARKAHRTCRAGTRTTFRTADDDEVSFRLSHTSRNGAHATFCYQLHADSSRRVDVLQVEDELGEVFDGVDVVMWWGRDEADARNGVACLGNDFVHLEPWQLTAFARLGTLCHLDLYLFCIHQIFSRHAETSRCNLLRLAAQAHTLHVCMVAGIILTTFTRVASCAELVHRQCQRLMCLDAQCTKTHGTRHKMLHDALHRLHFVEGRRLCRLLPSEEIADEDGLLLLVHHLLPLLKLLVTAQSCGNL